MSAKDDPRRRIQTAEESIRKWRVIQLASVLPLMFLVVLMLYFREASVFGILAFFLILVIGGMFPEMKSDITQIRLIIAEEQSMFHLQLQHLTREELRKFLKGTSVQCLMKGNAISSDQTVS
jgi:hypothetical protein